MDYPSESEDQQKSGVTWLPPQAPKWLLLAGFLLIAGWLGWKVWRLSQLALSLQSHQETAELLIADGFTNVDPDAAEQLVLGLRRDVIALKAETRLFLPLTPYLKWVPKVGPLLAEARPLLDMADYGTEAATYAVRGLKPALVLLQSSEGGGEEMLAQMLPILESAEPEMRQASAALGRFVEARNAIQNPEALPWRVQTVLQQVDDKLYLIDQFQLMPLLPQMLGSEGPRTYLIMAQNEDETRATGGFITGAGLLRVDGGRIVEMSFQDSNFVDDWENKPYDFPPQPLYQLMGLELFVFRDSNFWPHFPTSAEAAMELYEYGQDSAPLDGVIAIDQRFVAQLVAVTGPVNVPGVENPVTTGNVVASLRDAWGTEEGESLREWTPNRKDFLGPFAQALQRQLFSSLDTIDPLFLTKTIDEAIEQKHLQLYMRDAELAAVLDHLNWDGRLETPPNSDMLMVVDTNVGYNKISPLIQRQLAYQVTIAEDGTAMAKLTAHYEHSGEARADEICTQEVRYEPNPRYEQLISGCFWNYLRVYVPAGTDLVEGTEHSIPPDSVFFGQGWRGGAQVIGEPGDLTELENFFVLRPSDSLDSVYRYRLPQVVTEQEEVKKYQLSIFKQAGLSAEPVTIQITLPDGAELLSAPPGATVQEQTITLGLTHEADHVISILYQ